MTAFLLITATGGLAFALCRLLAHPRLGPQILDRPGARSLHDRPTPRTGGLAMLATLALGVGAALAVGLPVWLDAYVVAGAVLVAGVSFLDDVRGLHVAVRLFVHAVAAGLLVAGSYGLARLQVPGLGTLPLGGLGAVLTLVFVVWMTNLYNFMDGMDGFAGGMGFVGFTGLAIIAHGQGQADYALFAVLIAAVNLGFLGVNFPPARLFMGDAGAVPMGFLAAAFALAGVHFGLFGLWIPILAFSTFIVDATVTLMRRLLRGEKVWEAHRSHHYQRLVLLGWSHRRTVLAGYAVMVATSLSAVLVARQHASASAGGVVLGWSLIFLVLAVLIGRMEQRQSGETKP